MIELSFLSPSAIDFNAVPDDWLDHITTFVVQNPQRRYLYTIKVQPDDSSYRYRALMQKPQLVLKFSLPFYVEFPVGTYMTWQNQRFMLMRAQDLKKQGTRKIEYTMTLGTSEDYFGMWKLRNVVDAVEDGDDAPKDNRLKFSYCAKPHEFVDLLVRNLNNKDTSVTWERGECIEASEKTVEFNHSYIDAALTDIANAFNTEYEVEFIGLNRAKIHLRRVEYNNNTTDAVPLSYGVGNGFIPGVGRTSEADGVPVKRMFTQGTDRNIDRSKYGAPELLMPKSQSIRFDGNHFEDEDGFNEELARTYTTDAAGESVERTAPTVSDATKEDSLDCSEIYPSRIGVVTDVRVVNPDKNFYDIVDETIPDNLNFNDYLIAGETMTLIMQDGMLAGKEFDVKYIHTEVVNGVRVYAKRFEIVPQEIDGVIMPNATFCPVANANPENRQKYAVFGIQLPEEYICNNADKSGASWDMMRAAVRELYKAEDQRFTFTGSLQALYAKRKWNDIGGKLIIGGHVLFNDNQFAKDGVLIRIVGIKDYLTAPYSPTIELSNSVSAGSASVSSQLRQIENTEVIIEDVKRDVISYTKRRFRDAKETAEMLEEAMLDNFSNSISPVAVRTMAMLVGDESLQFQFVGVDQNDNEVVMNDVIKYENSTKQLQLSSTLDIYLKHYTLGINTITCQRIDNQYKRWRIGNNYTSPILADSEKKYYVYARCSKNDPTGRIRLSENAIKMEQESGFYHFLIGVLNSEYDGERSFVTLFGFTEILPGRITTDRIVSSDGDSYLALDTGALKLGDCLEYNLDGDRTLRLKFLTSENSNLGGWIFRDNLLISQKGTVGGNEAEYNDIEPDGRFPGGVFVPNISMDAVNGRIKQADNLVIDDDGISLLNERGEVAAHITNNTIGEIGDLANAADTKTEHVTKTQSQYLPFGGSNSYRQTLLIGIVDVGFLSTGSTITHNNSHIEFDVPSLSAGQTSNQIGCVFAQVKVELCRGNTMVATLATAVMTTRHEAGQRVYLDNDTSKVVTIGNSIPEGNYTIRMSVMYDLLGEHPAVLTDITANGWVDYSFSKYGFQRTVLGNDGFYTSWAQNQYIFANADGITLRHGEAVIRLSGDGLQKSTNGGNTFSSI